MYVCMLSPSFGLSAATNYSPVTLITDPVGTLIPYD